MAVVVLVGAFVLHLVAGWTAVRLAISSRRLWWSTVALAIVLMALWRVAGAYDVAVHRAAPDLGTELLAAAISVLTIVGMRAAAKANTALRRSNAALRRSDDRYRAAMESAMDAIVVVDATGCVRYANTAVESVFGYSPGDLIDRPFSLLAPEAESLFVQRIPTGSGARRPTLQIRGRHKDGRSLSLEATFGEHEEDGRVTMTGIMRDVTVRRNLEAELRTSEERYALASLGSNDGIWDWDLVTNQIFFSSRWKSIVGLAEDAPCSSSADWMGRVHPDDREAVRGLLMKHVDGLTDHFESEYRMLHLDGSYRWVSCRGVAVRGQSGNARRMAGSQTDITARKNAEERMLHDALHDTLTGLPNRALLLDRLQRCLVQCHRRGSDPCAILFVDLDRFKNVNDSLGHAIGDRLLVEVAHRLTLCVRPQDTVARLGGDEFAILLENLESRQAGIEIVDRLLASLSETLTLDAHELVTTASIGLVWGDALYEKPEDLLRDADAAMYHAKERGKARYEIFDSRMHDLACTRLALEAHLRRAIEQDAIEVVYQPIVSLVTGRTSGFEALARWTLEGRSVAPSQFIPIAEESGLIGALERRILKVAISNLAAWQKRFVTNPPLTMNLNLSGRHLRCPKLVEELREDLASTAVSPGSVRLEITETSLLNDDAHTMSVLVQLRKLGLELLIDDFGTGYSSLSYLHRLPIHAVKLDRSFVREMESSEGRATIVNAVVKLAKRLSLEIVAEGVETTAQLARLRRFGCSFGQGYFFSRPIAAEAAEAFVAREMDVLDDPTRGRRKRVRNNGRRLIA